MSKLDKRAISILVIAILALSFVLPLVTVAAPLGTPILTAPAGPGNYVKGETVTVSSAAGGEVTSGAPVEIYWDTALGDDAHLLNSTTGNADGSYDVDFDVPEAITGIHYVWVKDVSGPYYESVTLTVDPLVELSPSSGLRGDDVDVEGYGFGEETIIGIEIDPWTVSPAEIIGTGNGAIKTFGGTLDYFPVDPTTVSITDMGSVETITDDGAGGLSSTAGGTGTINYITGVYSVTFFTAPGIGPVTAVYDRDFVTIQSTSDFKTDELGSFIKTFDIPDFPYGIYTVSVAQTPALPALITANFKIGASISVTPEEGPTGTIVTVSGRGWTSTETITFRDEAAPYTAIEVVDRDTITVSSGGTFSADVVIPVLGAEGDYNIEALGSVTPTPSSDKFELTGLPEVEVSPTYGTPGASITVTGSNFTQISGIEVTVTLDTSTPTELVIAETNSDGTFEDTFVSPAVAFIGYTVIAVDEYFIEEEDAFKVGLIALIINPVYGEAGTEISITGIGFAPGSSFNVTFGTKVYEQYGTVTDPGEAISDTFYIPNVEPGTYDMTIIDEDENELTVQFSVTAATEVKLDPAMAPNTYNVTIEGYNFADKANEDVEFVLYNATEYWEMDVITDPGEVAVETGSDGNFTAYWMVLDEDILSLGDYTVNVTGYDDFFLQVPFSVVEARVSVAPRKLLFDRGDTIQFNVKNDFDFDESYMKIWDPYDNLYWQTETFSAWLKVGDLYTVPYYLQTSGKNPMTLSQDAPMGPWFYVFYEEGTTQLTNGTFNVGPSSAAQVEEKLTEIWDSMEGITENIDSITSEIEDEIDALSGEMDDVVSDVQGMIDDITSDLAGELAGVAADTEAAVGELEGSIGDIAAAQNALADEVADMSEDTAAARQAAEDAQEGTQGLTTIVYGAIACSLIAALAAVVSLMQISKKIA